MYLFNVHFYILLLVYDTHMNIIVTSFTLWSLAATHALGARGECREKLI